MKNKIIIFSIDRLGDYLIRSNVINKISKKYKFKEIVCSEKNYKLIKTQGVFDKINLFNTNYKLINKLIYFLSFFLAKYDSVIVFDGKGISNLILLVIRAKFKFTFIYRKKGVLNKIFFITKKFFLKKFKIKFSILYSREYIDSGCKEHYPSKYKKLKKYYKNINNTTYYFNEKNITKHNHDLKNYILIHLDEKFADIQNIKKDLTNSILRLSKNTNKKIILTSFNNNYEYYKNLNIKIINFKNINYNKELNHKIIIIENIPINDFYYFIKNSYINISCHAGFFIHTSLLLGKKSVDILDKKDEKWLNSWTPITKNYKKIYKTNTSEIFNRILKIINEK
tara:strand:+ start:253 stop:1269 length:1017 start_codon:yes stop_codon:yes gene_type:complete